MSKASKRGDTAGSQDKKAAAGQEDPKNKKKTTGEKDAAPSSRRSHAEEEFLAVSGAVTGAAAGSFAGPPGAIAGAVIGAAMGAVVGHTMDREDRRKSEHEELLDEEIGVMDGDLGAASPDQPPARIGAFSSASAGGDGAAPPAPSEGPMQTPDEK